MTLTALWLIVRRLLYVVVDHWQKMLIGLAILGLLIFTVVTYRGCQARKARIDQESINKINNANEKERKAELERVILENADVIKTVANTTTIADTNIVERNRLIDEKVKDADAKIAAAKRGGHDVTSAELHCILSPEECQ